MIKNKDSLYQEYPHGVVYCYSQYQDIFHSFSNDVHFFYGMPSIEDVDSFIEKFDNNFFILVLDDLMQEVYNSKLVADIASRIAHHSKISLLFLTQNIFSKGSKSRDISLNTHFFILCRTRRDIRQIAALGGQLFNNQTAFQKIYLDAVENPIQSELPPFLFVDCHPRGNKLFSLMSNLFPLNEVKVLYKID